MLGGVSCFGDAELVGLGQGQGRELWWGVCVWGGAIVLAGKRTYSHSGRPEVSESQRMTVLHAKCKHRVE